MARIIKFMKKKISLYLVATPIGNLNDMTFRSIETLKNVDFIAAEDTRNSGILLKHFDIKKPMISYFEHNRTERGEQIVQRLKNGETCALITDAGTPAISDPGEELVAQCLEQGLNVSSIPGACALISGLSMSGISTKRFCFEGFLSTAKNSRKAHLSGLADEQKTLIFYEAPHKLRQTLEDLFSFFGNRRISLIREISKIYEETFLTTIGQAIEFYKENDPKGEFVLVIEGAKQKTEIQPNDDDLEKFFQTQIKNGLNKTQAAKNTAQKFGMNKREIYDKFK